MPIRKIIPATHKRGQACRVTIINRKMYTKISFLGYSSLFLGCLFLTTCGVKHATPDNNPLLQPYETPWGSIPFNRVDISHYRPAYKVLLARTQSRISEIAQNSAPPSFSNTIEALEYASKDLDGMIRVFFHLNNVSSSDKMQQIAEEISVKQSQLSNDILLNADLFSRVKAVYDSREEEAAYTPEQRTLLENTYRDFVRNGASLDRSDKARLREIDTQLASLAQSFSKHVLKATEAYILHITDSSQLSGLGDYEISMARNEAEERGKKGWVFTLKAPSYQALMSYSSVREIREKIYRAYSSRAIAGEWDNRSVVADIVRLRHARAQLLGYGVHADYVLSRRMAKTKENVMSFLMRVKEVAYPAAKEELGSLRALAKEDGVDTLQAWDVSYYIEKKKKAQYAIDDAFLKNYFPVDQVFEGVFSLSQRLFGIRFEQDKTIPTYDSLVRVYRVLDWDGSHLALLYADLYARAGKRGGAWMNDLRPQHRYGEEDIRPHISITANFPPPQSGSPSLLTLQEVETLFHEFGHALHGMLSAVHYPSLSGTNVFWDFVEFPSQVLENWVVRPECLPLFARHYQTQEELDASYLSRIAQLRKYMAGYFTLRQLQFGFLDMAWHGVIPGNEVDVLAYEREVLSDVASFPSVEGTNISCHFSHIFAGGYSAGYYSYKWAEMLDADTFEWFMERGIFDRDLGKRYRTAYFV